MMRVCTTYMHGLVSWWRGEAMTLSLWLWYEPYIYGIILMVWRKSIIKSKITHIILQRMGMRWRWVARIGAMARCHTSHCWKADDDNRRRRHHSLRSLPLELAVSRAGWECGSQKASRRADGEMEGERDRSVLVCRLLIPHSLHFFSSTAASTFFLLSSSTFYSFNRRFFPLSPYMHIAESVSWRHFPIFGSEFQCNRRASDHDL